MDAFNFAAVKLGLQGVTLIAASGDDGVSGSLFRLDYPTRECGYYAMFPASSPYVTAVGGTKGGTNINSTPRSKEVACSARTGASITSGGGFSSYSPASSFQIPFISNYFDQFNSSTMPAQGNHMYDTSKRAYPDIALAASNYGIFEIRFAIRLYCKYIYVFCSVTVINRNFYLVSGTSAAAPVFAGMVSLGSKDSNLIMITYLR